MNENNLLKKSISMVLNNLGLIILYVIISIIADSKKQSFRLIYLLLTPIIPWIIYKFYEDHLDNKGLSIGKTIKKYFFRYLKIIFIVFIPILIVIISIIIINPDYKMATGYRFIILLSIIRYFFIFSIPYMYYKDQGATNSLIFAMKYSLNIKKTYPIWIMLLIQMPIIYFNINISLDFYFDYEILELIIKNTLTYFTYFTTLSMGILILKKDQTSDNKNNI